MDVAGCYINDPATPAPELSKKAWVGVTSLEFESAVAFDPVSIEGVTFGAGMIPFADALKRVVDDQFAFATAESGGGGEGRKDISAESWRAG